MKFHGVLPEVPAVADSSGADLTTLTGYLNAGRRRPGGLRSDDTYWTGKGLGRAARIAEIADQLGDTAARDRGAQRHQDRRSPTGSPPRPGKTSPGLLLRQELGHPDRLPGLLRLRQELNDHHFHYGYFIAAAATLAKFDPAWAADQPVRRHGRPADQGRQQLRPHRHPVPVPARLRHLRRPRLGLRARGVRRRQQPGVLVGGHELRQRPDPVGPGDRQHGGPRRRHLHLHDPGGGDPGLLVRHGNQNFPRGVRAHTVGMVWGDGGAYATWFSADPEKIQGINMLPITGGHFTWATTRPTSRPTTTRWSRNNGGPPTVWQDILWEFLALGQRRRRPGQLPGEHAATPPRRARARRTRSTGSATSPRSATWTRSVTADYPLADGVHQERRADLRRVEHHRQRDHGDLLRRHRRSPCRRARPSPPARRTGAAATRAAATPPVTPTPTPTPDRPPRPPTPHADAATTPAPSPRPATCRRGGALPGAAGTAGTLTAGRRQRQLRRHARTTRRCSPPPASPPPTTAAPTAFDLFVDAGHHGRQRQPGPGLLRPDRQRQLGPGGDLPLLRHRPGRRARSTTPRPPSRSSSGTLGNLSDGQVRVEVWNAIGSGTTTLGIGNQSLIRLPFS